MNIYKLTHSYSPENMHIVISSEMSYIDLWNTIVLLQLTFNDIDSSHGITQANAATFLTKYFDAMVHNPASYYDARAVQEVDLYVNWECGFLDANNNSVRGEATKAFEQKYDFYQPEMYSYLLDMIMRDHPLFEGEVGSNDSFGMSNARWQKLFAEGVYDVARINELREQQMQQEKLQLEENIPMHKIAFSNDHSENYHVSLHTTIELGLNEENELWLSTTSVSEAMLIGMYFRQNPIVNDGLISIEYKGNWSRVVFFLLYQDEAKARQALSGFDEYYKQIYDESNSNKYLRGELYGSTGIANNCNLEIME